MEAKLLLIQALSPIHAGTGQGVGVIDQPIAREKATDIPFVPGSTIKGVLRDASPDADRNNIFGPDTGEAELYAGAVTFTDARLLLLPIRSLKGVFAWVTSPLLLSRLIRDANSAGISGLPKKAPSQNVDTECLVSENNSVLTMTGNKVVLEDLELSGKKSTEVDVWATWLAGALSLDPKERLCIVSDDTLGFLLETATEITARIRLEDDTKTVAQGALWYEESLPVETVLVSMVIAANNTRVKPGKVFTTVNSLTENTLQFGGNATVGRGLCKATLLGVNP